LWAQLAKRFTFLHLSGRGLNLTYDSEPLDKHGRVLAYAWMKDGVLFNELIIRRGFAHAYLSYPFRSDLERRFEEAEKEAKAERRGMWREEEPEALSPDKAGLKLGEYISVKFTPAAISENRFFIYLSSPGSEFEALIPQERRKLFPPPESLRGGEIAVTGFLERFKSRLQIILFFPRQLKSETSLVQ
jgi:micrococcal nuclease